MKDNPTMRTSGLSFPDSSDNPGLDIPTLSSIEQGKIEASLSKDLDIESRDI